MENVMDIRKKEGGREYQHPPAKSMKKKKLSSICITCLLFTGNNISKKCEQNVMQF